MATADPTPSAHPSTVCSARSVVLSSLLQTAGVGLGGSTGTWEMPSSTASDRLIGRGRRPSAVGTFDGVAPATRVGAVPSDGDRWAAVRRWQSDLDGSSLEDPW